MSNEIFVLCKSTYICRFNLYRTCHTQVLGHQSADAAAAGLWLVEYRAQRRWRRGVSLLCGEDG